MSEETVDQVDNTEREQTELETDQGNQGEQTEQEQGKPHREAAKYRTQLREVQAERDTLAAKVEAMQRAEVERVAGETLKKPAGIWAAGVNVADLLADDGAVDPAKVAAAAKHAADSLGLAPRYSLYVPREGSNPGGGGGGNGMADVIRG